MMKSLAALATLATLSMAKKSKWPKLVVNYDVEVDEDEEDTVRIDYLALVEGVPTTIKYPFDWRQKKTDCEGWIIVNEPTDGMGFETFDFTETKPGAWCNKIEFMVKPNSIDDNGDYPCVEMEFLNTCDPVEDDEGNDIE